MIITIIVAICIALGIYSYQKSNSKKKVIDPNELADLLLLHVSFYKKLNDVDRKVFIKKVNIFLKGIYIDSVEFKLENLDIVLVAASAIIPVFYFKNWEYNNLSTVIIYPDNFNKDLKFSGKNRNILGLVGSGRYEKQMILSRKALHYGFSNSTDNNNTGIHEFVHLIDKMDGDVDGVPKMLLSNAYVIPWLKLIHKEMEAINNNKSDIRSYGAFNQQEFFAVAAEYFFESPKLLKEKHPELYRMMEDCFCKKQID